MPVFAVVAELLPVAQCPPPTASHGTFTDRQYFLPFSHHRQRGTTHELPAQVTSETLALFNQQCSVSTILDDEDTAAIPATTLPSGRPDQWTWLPNLPFRTALRINHQAIATASQQQTMQDTEAERPLTTILIHLPGLYDDVPDGVPDLTQFVPLEVWIGSAQYGHSLRPIDTTINRSYTPTSLVNMLNASAVSTQLSTSPLIADAPRAMHEAAGDEGAIALLAARLHQIIQALCPTPLRYCIYSFSAGTKMAGALHRAIKTLHMVEVRSVLVSPAMSMNDWAIIADLCSPCSEVTVVSHPEDQLCSLNIAELPPILRQSCMHVKLSSLNMWQSGSTPHDLRSVINARNAPALFEWLLKPNQPHPVGATDESLSAIATQQPIVLTSSAPASVKDVFFAILLTLLDNNSGIMAGASIRAANP